MHGPKASSERETDQGPLPALALTMIVGSAVWVAARSLFATPVPAIATGVLFGCIAIIALPGYLRQRPRPRFGAANGVTLFRAALIAFVCGFAAEPPPAEAAVWWIAAATAGVALLLDGVDGWLARRTAGGSAFGARFDMETDALAALVLCLVLWRADRTGGWILLLGALRYLFVLAGWAFDWMRRPLPPSQRRRAVCAVQGALLALGLVPVLTAAMPPILGAVALTITAASFLIDTIWLYRRRDDARDPRPVDLERKR